MSSLIDDFKEMDSTFMSVFNVQNFDIDTTVSNEDKHYMGICLPKNVTILFPNQAEIFRQPYIFPESVSWDTISDTECDDTPSPKESRFLRHFKQHCLRCSQSEHDLEVDAATETARAEVLRNVEKLANPVWNKQVRSHLLRFKQREPNVFRDICTYSEVCKMLSETAYRLSTRRLLHELFFDVSFICFYDLPTNFLEKEGKMETVPEEVASTGPAINQVERKSFSSDVSSPTESVKTLDSLKLIFNENKFPIRKNSN